MPRQPSTKTPRPRRMSGAIDQAPQSAAAYDEDGRVTGSGIRIVKQQHDNNVAKTRERAAECRTLLAGEMPQVLPENFKLANADAFAADLPATYTRPAEMLSQNLKKQVEIRRFITTESQRSKTTSSTIEQILTAVMTQTENPYPWDQTCDVVQNDALGCVITQPMPTFWEQAPDWQDPDTKTFKTAYQRDGQGRTKSEAGTGFRLNKKTSKKAYEEQLADWKAQHVPVMYRAFGPQEFTPIFGPRYNVEAVIVSGMYQRTSEMAMQFMWGEDGHLSPQGAGQSAYATSGVGYGEVEILEYWGYDRKRKPYVSYCVDGMKTTYVDGEPAVIDLSPYCSRLPASVKWGQHWPGAPKIDQRALPYMWAFLKSIKQANAICTGIAVALWWAGFPTYVTDRSAATVPISPGATPRTLDIEPLKLIETDGPVTRLSGGEVSQDAWRFIQLLLGENEKAQPSSSASGKGDASGFAQTIARAYSEDAQYQILEGIRGLYEESASFTLEIMTRIAQQKDRPVLVYYSGPVVSLAENDNVSSTRARLELTPDLAGDQWKVSAVYRPSMSLAERQQSGELVERRLKTRYKHLADDGDPAPERTLAQIEAEDLVASDIGQQQRWALIAKILGDDQMAEMVKLKTDQKITMQSGLPFSLAEGFEDILAKRAAAESASSGGAQMPMPAPMPGGVVGGPGVQPGMPQGGPMTGLSNGGAAQSALAGSIGGEMQTGPLNNAAAAGGVIPQTMIPGG